jgi:rhodanese-related sulfurtransferase
MKRVLAICAALVVAVSAHAAKYPEVTIKELKSAMESKSVVLLDANGTDSYKSGHIPGAIDFEAQGKNLASVLPKDKNALIVAYCGGPQCSAYQSAAKAAEKLGYKNVKHLPAGISGWEKAGEKMASAK